MRKATETPDPECWSASWCAEHGPDVRVDEDGCCVTCGNGALGPGAEQASRDRRRLAKALRDRRALAQWLQILMLCVPHAGIAMAQRGSVRARCEGDCVRDGPCRRCEAGAILHAHGPRRKR